MEFVEEEFLFFFREVGTFGLVKSNEFIVRNLGFGLGFVIDLNIFFLEFRAVIYVRSDKRFVIIVLV